MNSAKILWFNLLFLFLFSQGCSLFHRHPRAENLENESKGKPLKHEADARSANEEELVAKAAYEKAKENFERKDYKSAAEQFKGILKDYPLFRNSDEAAFMLGHSLMQIGKYDESFSPLKRVIESTTNISVYGFALLDYCEGLIHMNRFDEALAATFQIAPDADLQNKLGVNALSFTRKQKTTLLSHRVKAYLLRARILTAIDSPYAKETLDKGKRLFNDARGFGIPVTESGPLEAEMGFRELEILSITCSRLTQPTTSTEESIINYLDEFYKCTETSKVYLCDVEKSGKNIFYSQTRAAYKSLVFFPLTLKNHLPPPGRALKDESFKQNFENDIKLLIDKKVEEHSSLFKNIEECNLSQIF